MKITIQSVHVEPKEAFKTHLRETLNKLEEKYQWIIRGEVFLRKDHADDQEDKIVEIKLSVPGEYIFAERREDSFELAAKKALEAVRKQLRKQKEKNFGHPTSSPMKG